MQLQILSNELGEKRLGYVNQLKSLNEMQQEMTVGNPAEVDRVVDLVIRSMANIQPGEKFKIIHDLIDKITVYEGGEVEIEGHLALFNLKLGYEPIGRNCRITERGEIDPV